MPIDAFHHINIRSTDVEASCDFYVRVLGLRIGDRPPFAFKGYWLYLGDHAVVHLAQRAPGEVAQPGPGSLDHVAFHASDLESTRTQLAAAGIECRESVVPRDQTVQIFLHDPDGVKIELNFSA